MHRVVRKIDLAASPWLAEIELNVLEHFRGFEPPWIAFGCLGIGLRVRDEGNARS